MTVTSPDPATATQERRAPRGALRTASWWGLAAALLGVWFWGFAPSSLGGRATMVVVHGSSMEPLLHGGDVVVVHQQDDYRVGDLVVFLTEERGEVIHRLVEHTPTGWLTRGDNRPSNDLWTVPDGAILGKQWLTIPVVGKTLPWIHDHMLAFATLCAVLAMVPYLPHHRRLIDGVLASALANSVDEPHREGRTREEYGVVAISGVAMAISIALLVRTWASTSLISTSGLIGAIALAWSGGFTIVLARRLWDGAGVAEPSHSLYALSGRLHLVDELPELVDEPVHLHDALELRRIAEDYRLPVLHHVDPVTGSHEFLLITVQRGAFEFHTVPDPTAA